MPGISLEQIDYEQTSHGFQAISGEPQKVHGLHESELTYDDVLARLKEGNENYQVITGPLGITYEMTVFNAGKMATSRVLKPSTSFSSAYKNPGNMLETALTAAANPGAAYIYIGSFGNRPTGHMPYRDLKHVRQTGRYTSGNGTAAHPYRAIGSVEDMAESLVGEYGAPTHVTADVEAGRLGLGLMAAFEKDSVKGAHLNGLDGISHAASYEKAKLSEDLSSRLQRRKKDGRPGEVTPINIKDVKKRMPAIYHGLGRIAHLAPLPVLLYPRDDFDKLNTLLGFRGHDDLGNLPNHAVFQDMQAALRQQHMVATLRFNKESAIHNLADCVKFGALVMDHLPPEQQKDGRGIRLLIGDGTLDYRTDNPYDSARVERYAFPDILHKMSLLPGGLSLDTEVFRLQPLRRSA